VTQVSFRRALGLGATTAFSRASAPLLLGLAALSSSLCSTLLSMTGVAALVDGGARVRFVGLLVAALVAWVLQASVLGGAVQQAGAAMRGAPVLPLPEAILSAAPRALRWACLAGAAVLAWNGWTLMVGGSGLLLFFRGLLHGSGGVQGALGLALAATLGPLVAVFVQLVAEMTLVRSVLRAEPPASSAWEAARSLLVRPWAPLGLLALTAFLAATLAGAVAVLAHTGPHRPFRLAGGTALVQLALGSLALALAQLVRLFAFCALELGQSGELVAPAAPPPPATAVPRAELVVDSGPILEARAVAGAPGPHN
jgi:hypothetical protein